MNKVFVVAVLGAALSFWMSSPSNAQSVLVVKWGPWSNWTKCSVSCGGGEMTKERRCITPGVSEQRCLRLRRRECARKRCPVLDETPGMMSTATQTFTEMSYSMPTTEESLNTMGGDMKPSDGTVTMPTPQGMTDMKPDGEPNVNITTEGMTYTRPTTEGMPDTKDYSMSPWGEWSLCEAQCGGGMRYRTRECVDPSKGPECENAEGQKCNTQPCSDGIPTGEPGVTEDVVEDVKPTPEQIPDITPTPEDYSMYPWSEWFPCEAKCGGGMQYRARQCEESSGRPECEDAENRTCNTLPCDTPIPAGEPPITDVHEEGDISKPDMEYTAWSSWTSCSTSCGGGMRYRIRECNKLNGHTDCEESVDETCNTQKCSERSNKSTLESTNPDPAFSTEPVPMPEMINTSKMTSKAPLSGREARQRAKELRLQCGNSRTEASIHTFVTAISPGFPKDYPGGLDCMWTVVAPRATRVEIIIDIFEASVGDKLTLLEGRPREMPYKEARITTLTGTIEQGTKYSSISRYLTVRLQTKMNTMGGKYSIRFLATTTKLEDEDDHENPETAPEEETWYKILRLLLTWLYRRQKEM